MIIDLDRFIVEERPIWIELGGLLERIANDPDRRLNLEQVRRFHYLYQRTSADLAKLTTFSFEPETRRYLESLVERAYGEIHETRDRPHRLAPFHWFFNTFPQAFRRRYRAFLLALGVFLIGVVFGGLALGLDPEAKDAIMPFRHLMGDPSERVAEEEAADEDVMEGVKSSFSSQLMTHNTKVAIFTLAMGITWGIGTFILLFYNGVILGAVALDYILAGEGTFLAGWLLPHGSIEIPAILLAGQAGLVLAGALVGWGSPESLRTRMRSITGDLVTLIFGVAVMLVWAGIIESFLSQYHEPVSPYGVKIGFGLTELGLLIWFLWKSGTKTEKRSAA